MATPSSWFEGFPDQITAEDYAALPEEFCKTIEVIDGHVVKCESPSRVHNRVVLNLAIAFKAGRKPEPCLMVDTDIDVRITDVPLNIRQPDVTVSRCIPDSERLYSRDVVLVAERDRLRERRRGARRRQPRGRHDSRHGGGDSR